MFFVNALNQFYWVAGATSGALLGYVIHFNTKGIDFVMTALFVVMFINQWEEAEDHKPALVGVVCSVICLILFGSCLLYTSGLNADKSRFAVTNSMEPA